MKPARLSILLCAAVACASCSWSRPVLTLDSTGGEAWTFSKRISGTAPSEACETIVVQTGAASVEASRSGDRFVANTPLRSGVNELHAECRNDGRVSARSETQQWLLQLPDRPKAWIRLRTTSKSVWLDAGRSEEARGSPAPLVRFEWSARARNPAPLAGAESGTALDRIAGEQVELAAPTMDGEYYVELRVVDALGRTDRSTAVFRVQAGQAKEVDLASEHPAWVDDAVVYGIAPFFFGPGGFDSVRERLDEIAALGATALWLSPVTQTATGDFGYAVTDHFRLREAFGGPDDFRKMVETAHGLGLKVLMDFVPNHVSDQHRYYIDARREGGRSAYYRWFERDEQGEATNYFNWTNLKNLNYDNEEVQNHVIAAFAHWVAEFGVDGFRVDASWAVRERAPEFWPRWREELKRIDPDLLLLAEGSARDPYFVANGFDAAYDWSANLGEWAWDEVFGGDGVDLKRLRSALTNCGRGYPPDTLIFRFLNNNDTGARFITRHGAALTRAAAALLFTLPGIPLIYNGDEVGAEFEPYDEGPPIQWRDVRELTPHYTRLAALRRDTPALHGRDFELLPTTHEDAVLAYVRPGKTRRDAVIVLLNFSAQPLDVNLQQSEIVRTVAPSGVLHELLSDSRIRIDPHEPVVAIDAYQALLLAGPDLRD